MSSQTIVAGPIQFYYGNTLQFLGWSEGDTEISEEGAFSDVMADFGGDKIPVDKQQMGIQAFVSATLVYINDAAIDAMLARIQGGTTGQIIANQIGTLMTGQGAGQRLLLNCPYQGISGMSAQVPAYNYPNAWLTDATQISVSTKYKKYRLTWQALPKWNVTAGTALLRNSDISGMPGPS